MKWLRNNVGDQLILDLRDQIFQRQLALFQALDRELIGRAAAILHRLNGVIQIAVLAAQNLELHAQDFFAVHLAGYVHGLPESLGNREA